MSEEVIMVHVAEDGRVTIPVQYRRAIGMGTGGVAVLRVENGEIRLRPIWAVLAALQGKPRKHVSVSGGSTGQFPCERGEEPSREGC
jgi:bifunctional DNA-binding transcriptional regulator/antitoxin component of YhaV-PrlF toxin-antitoxin module